LVGGTAVAVGSSALAALHGAPYIGSPLNPWIVLLGIGAFVALISVPFLARQRIAVSHPDGDTAWERAMLVWGAVALVALAAGVGLIGAGGYSAAGSLADAAGVLLAVEAALVLLVLASWMLLG
jgi:hypothetical protein